MTPSIRILNSGRLDERDSAFPQAVQLLNEDILCSFSVGGGQFVHGGSDWARSTDGGETWPQTGVILPPTEDPPTANFLKLSLSHDGRTIYAYGTRFVGSPDEQYGKRRGETVLCTSTDEGRTWSAPQEIPMFPADEECPLEVSHALLPLESGRLLAPAATLPSEDRLGEEVYVAVSDDGGQTWPARRTVFRDADNRFGFWEQKLAKIGPRRVMATAWTVTLGDYRDQPNHFSISEDDGWTWTAPQSTGVRGQTMTPLWLGDDRLLVLYNRRFGEQGIVACLATFDESSWKIHHEQLLYDAGQYSDGPSGKTGVDELASFQFGFPTTIRLNDGAYLSTHWCVEQGVCGIRWTKLRIDWP